MNVNVTMFDKLTGKIMGEKVANLPLGILPQNISEKFYLEPDEILGSLDKTFTNYDCVLEIV